MVRALYKETFVSRIGHYVQRRLRQRSEPSLIQKVFPDSDFSFSFIHFIFIFLTTVAPSICIDCFAGGRAEVNIIYKFKPNLQSLITKRKKKNFKWKYIKKDYQPSMTSFSLLLKVKREGASLMLQITKISKFEASLVLEIFQ